ncbi:RNA polymerase sigma-70 factor [Pedobacter heparinus]|uniref:RNA polymerase sigma-70 factor n=1 Tax=Pedobacter heparinus (strain ATCC 13125 / DSM 2366 / CIP 104194 / JCM 7457 / NBRC 12017 / NCIMB 9290 / NRRL B-14731 / HIM 762-3) TaxID=485917 RepID=C6XWB0_PEDHD|nr:RNA polymerase sigma-70 factor [Pedobacter heparinus]ACU04189.1 RNA polymerase sigma-70 factor [Pedobacter heparinus DSM 2366]
MGDYSTYTDQELLVLIKAEDYSAFNEIYHRHADALYGSAYNILRDRDSCRDVIQDIFIWLWQNRLHLNISNCRAYLLTAVKFKTANYIRDNKIGKGFFMELSTVELSSDDEENAIEVRQLSDFIKSLADQLPGRYGEIFRLSRYQQLSNKEIALQMGISEKTVENQMTIALKKIKEKLGPGSALMFFFL